MILKLNKMASNAAQGVAMALHLNIAQFIGHEWWFHWYLERGVNEYKILNLHLNLFFTAKAVMLDLKYTKFMDGEVVNYPDQGVPIDSDYENQAMTKARDKWQENEFQYQQQRLKLIYESAANVVRLIDLYLEIINPEVPPADQEDDAPDDFSMNPDEEQDFQTYIQTLSDLWALMTFFIEKMDSLIEIAYAKGVLIRPEAGDPYFMEKMVKSLNKADSSDPDGPENSFDLVIKKVNKDEGLITGVVLAPGSPKKRDYHGHWMTKEAIYRSMVGYMEKHQRLGYMHKYFPEKQGKDNPHARLIENYIVKEAEGETINGVKLPQGTWIQTWKVLNPKWKKQVKDGKLNGFSVGGYASIKKDQAADAA